MHVVVRHAAKRLFDISVAAVALIVLAPVIAAVTVLIRRSSPGPALFIQPRVGRGERPFRCYKFRTMATDAPVAGSHEVGARWITPLGRRLRSSKLDELPQLLNVLLGEMSLVGPRPCLPSQTNVILARRALGVFAVRPGITGPAQLAGIDMSTPAELATADRGYVDGQSFFGDLKLLLDTVFGKGRGDAALR